ncbi:MAG: site-specific integrase [Elainella sp. Prado103]|nr:site-specific integrase [Elainella sp. Prado103]
MKNNRHGQAAIMTDRDRSLIRRQLNNDSHKLFFDIACWTGERWGAIAQLQVGDVYADPVLSVPHEQITFRRATRKASPNGERFTRQVWIHPHLQDSLLAYNPTLKGSDWLFPSPLGNRPISFSACDKWFRTAVLEAGLDHKGFSTHSTRRTLITKLSEQGTDWKVIQAITGHRDIKTLARYIEVDTKRVSAALSAVS